LRGGVERRLVAYVDLIGNYSASEAARRRAARDESEN
jgi:hypothetical protein